MYCKIIFSSLLIFLLAGCVDLSPYQQSPAPVINDQSTTYKIDSNIDNNQSAETISYKQHYKERAAKVADPLVLSLLEASKQTEREGDLQAAISTLERGVRIRPRNPLLWAQLAELRLQQGKAILAENLAKKSLALIQSKRNRGLQARNWQTIAYSLQRQGKSKAALGAKEKVRVLRGY